MDVNEESESACGNNNIHCVLEFLRNGTSKIDFSKYNEAVLILGPTGSGKSTLTQFLAGDNDKLHPVFDQNDDQFYFIDEASKIRKNVTFESQTKIPEVVYDKDTKTAYIDCPGFDDNREEAQDIGIAYFIAQVFKQIKNVKLLLVISNNLIESNGDRDNLLRLLQHVSVLLKNVDKYVDSIALVVTKIGSKVSERKTINRIVNTLQQAKIFMLNKQKNRPIIQTKEVDIQKQLYNQYAVTLLDSLIQTGEGEVVTSKIGIFRRPNEEKPLSSMPLFQENKSALKRMIGELKYSSIDEHDIGYAISEKSKTTIHFLDSEASELIVNNIGQIGEIVIKYYENMEANMVEDDMFLLLERLTNVHKFLISLQKSPGNDWVAQYRAHLDKPCIRASKQYLNDMASLSNFIIFLEKMDGKKLNSYAPEWIKKLNVCIHSIENSIKWYQFLAELYQTLSKYKIQKNRDAFVVPKLEQYEGPLGKWEDFIAFVEKLQDSDLFKTISFQDLQKLKIDNNKIKYFNQVIESAMGSVISYHSFDRGQSLQITGDYIVFSDLVNNKMYQSSKSVQIMATHTVFIDANLTKENDLLVIAPKWTIIDSPVISLDGSFGPFHRNFRASSDTCSGRGKDGVPGNAGESAGHFFGIGMNFKNPEKLTISAVGGPGGNGQHGGDGQPGKNSGSAQPLQKSNPNHLQCPYEVSCDINFTYQDTSTVAAYGIEGLSTIEMRVLDGGRGGDCGFGGGPGKGGHGGTAEILNLGSEQFSIEAKIGEGRDGLFGFHGRVGKGGVGGDQYNVHYIFQDNKPFTKYENHRLNWSRSGDPGSCLHSKHPSYSYNEFNKNELFDWQLNRETTNMNLGESPSKKTILYKISDVLTNYRNLLIDNFSSSIKKRYSLQFYGALLQNEYISTNDTIPGIFAEVEHLETCHNKFTEDINQIIYLSLQKRMQTKEKNMSQAERSQHQDLIDILSLTITSKLIRFKTIEIPQMVSDLQVYVNVLKTTNPVKIFSYFSEIIRTESNQTISYLIDTIDVDISNVIEQKTREIVESFGQPNNKELTENLLNRKLFSCFKTITIFLKLCESLATTDMEFANTMNITQIIPSVRPSSLPINAETIMKNMKTMEKILYYESEAAEAAFFLAQDKFNSLGSDLDYVKKQISEIQQVFQSYETSISSSYDYPLFSNSSSVIRKINDISLEKYGENDDHKANEIIQNLQNAFKLIAFDANLYYRLTLKNISPESVIPALNTLLENNAISFTSVEHEIFKIMKPVLISVCENLEGKLYKPKDIIKLREIIVQALKQMKFYLIKMASEFEVTKNFQYLTENFDEAIILLLNAYQGVLPTYHDRALLNNLYLYFENQKTTNTVYAKMSNTIMGDILFYEYERLIQVYKKSVFPFDILSPETFSVPTQLPLISGTSSTSFEQSFVSNIQDLESKLDIWRNSKKLDADLFSKENASGPFFTWKYDDYGDQIRKLLRGEKVAMKAKLSKRDSSFLTFTDIRLKFNLKDSANQTKFDNQLKNFKVTMTHSGNSYFSLCDRTHLYNQAATNYVYNFESIEGEVGSDENYYQADFDSSTYYNDNECNLERPALSPFALWIFEMTPISDEVTFKSIKSFSEVEIDLDLDGHAKFITLNDEKAMCLKIETNSDSIGEELLTIDLNKEMINVDGDIFRDKTKRWIPLFIAGAAVGVAATAVIIIYGPDIISKLLSKIKRWWGEEMVPYYHPSIMPSAPPPLITTQHPCKSVQSLDTNSTLLFINYITMNITKEKLFNAFDKPITPAEARITALVITDEFRNKMTEQQWETVDPIELMSKLERNILNQDIMAISKTLTDTVGEIHASLEQMKC